MKNLFYNLKYKIKNVWSNPIGKIFFIGIPLFIVLIVVLITTKGNQTETTENTAIAINDYNGCENRIESVKGDITDFMTAVMERNQSIKSENPSNYWSDNTFQEFLTDVVDLSTFKHTAYYNEGQTTWDEVDGYVKQSFGDSDKYTLIRHDKDDYELNYRLETSGGDTIDSSWLADDSVYLDQKMISKYSSNSDWLQNIHTVTANGFVDIDGNVENVNNELFEYGHYTNGDKEYVLMQTTFERMIVEYTNKTSTDEDGNKTTSKEITNFCYSKLDGSVRPTIASNRVYDEDREAQDESVFVKDMVTKEGYVRDRYNLSESMFTSFDKLSDIDKSWVFGNDYYTQTIYYDGKNVNITTLNKLSKKYESYAFDKESGKSVKATDNVVVPEETESGSDDLHISGEYKMTDDTHFVLNDVIYEIESVDDKKYAIVNTETESAKYEIVKMDDTNIELNSIESSKELPNDESSTTEEKNEE